MPCVITTTSISLLKWLANLFTISASKCFVFATSWIRYCNVTRWIFTKFQLHTYVFLGSSGLLKWLSTSLYVLYNRVNLTYFIYLAEIVVNRVNVFRSHCLKKCTGFSVSLVKNVICVFIWFTALYVFGQGEWVLRFVVIDLLVLNNLLVPWSHIHLYVKY